MEGIVEVSFDLAERLATVVYDPAAADIEAIYDAVDRANEMMRPEDDEADKAGRILG